MHHTTKKSNLYPSALRHVIIKDASTLENSIQWTCCCIGNFKLIDRVEVLLLITIGLRLPFKIDTSREHPTLTEAGYLHSPQPPQ